MAGYRAALSTRQQLGRVACGEEGRATPGITWVQFVPGGADRSQTSSFGNASTTPARGRASLIAVRSSEAVVTQLSITVHTRSSNCSALSPKPVKSATGWGTEATAVRRGASDRCPSN